MRDLQQRIATLRQRLQAGGEDLGKLEAEARALLSEAKNTVYEADAQAIFAELAQRSRSDEVNNPQLRGLVRRARIRIEMAGDEDDIDEAIDILTEAVANYPADREVIALLQEAADKTPHAAMRVRDIFSRYGIDAEVKSASTPPATRNDSPAPSTRSQSSQESSAQSAARSDSTPPPRSSTPLPPQPQTTPSGMDYADLDDMLSDLSEAYYAGNYQQTVDIANRILSRDPNNQAAMDYRQKSEDNLIRGVVPDHRIPFEARVSYNRANSLVRAGNYEEASKLYREARELAERDGILTWKDVEQALLDIQDLALARELMNEGDRLMAGDNWAEALRKYEGALRVVPNDPQVDERVEMIRKVQQDVDSAAVELAMLGGSLQEQVEQLQRVKSKLARVRQLLPTSQRLARMQQEADGHLTGVKGQLREQSRAMLERSANATNIEDKLALSNEALRLSEFATTLDPNDSQAAAMLLEARTAATEFQRARQTIERASKLVAQNYEAELVQARNMLAGLSENAQDERYRMVVNELFTRYMEQAEIALQDGNMAAAAQWIDAMREEPFRILGRRAEIYRIENFIRGRRNRSRGIVGGIVIIILGILLATGWSFRSQIEAFCCPTATFTPESTFTPTMTYTPSDTPTPSETYTPSLTPTASETFTPTSTPTWTQTPSPTWTPSWTPTASLTPTASRTPTETATPTETYTPTPSETSTPTSTVTLTPSITPTPPGLCRIFASLQQGINMREEPNVNSERIRILEPATPMDVLEILPPTQGLNRYWLYVRVDTPQGQIFGWVRDDTIRELTDCPGLPNAEGQ